MRLVIEGSEEGCREFQEANGAEVLLDLIKSDNGHNYVFSLLHTLVSNNPTVEIERIINLLSSNISNIQGMFCLYIL